jgi:hypothetical protein
MTMLTRVGHNGYVVAHCDYCPNTTEFVGFHRAEEKVKAMGWTIRHGRARCPACTEIEQMALARAVKHALP